MISMIRVGTVEAFEALVVRYRRSYRYSGTWYRSGRWPYHGISWIAIHEFWFCRHPVVFPRMLIWTRMSKTRPFPKRF